MYSLLVTYKFENKEKRDGFLEAVTDDRIASIVRKEDGCLRYDYEVPEESNILLLYEEWETKDHQIVHTKQPTMNRIKAYKIRFGAETVIDELSAPEALPDPNALFPNPAIPSLCYIKNAIKNPRIIVGDYTYYDDVNGADKFEEHVTHFYDFIGDKLIIGKFCSIAKGIEFVMNGANHPMNGTTTYPFYIMGGRWRSALAPHTDELPLKGDTVVGNDVWIGQNVTVLPGVHIGNGAIIGANSVVASNIPSYSIAVGNPARVVKKRFDDEMINLLEIFKWWDKDIEEINELIPLLSDSDIETVKQTIRDYNAR